MEWDELDKMKKIRGIVKDNREINRKLAAIDKGRPLSSDSKEELISLLNTNNKIKNKYMNKYRDMRILDDPEGFFKDMNSEEFMRLLDEFGFNYELKDGVEIE